MQRDNLSDDLRSRTWKVAERAHSLYAQGVLPIEVLAIHIIDEWQAIQCEDDEPSQAVLMRIAQRICSCELFYAWRSPDCTRRNCAFHNLREYLDRSLRQTRYARLLQSTADAFEDVLHQTLETLHLELFRGEQAGPRDPAAFLKWAQTILIRHARLFVLKYQHDTWLSLDAQAELLGERLVDNKNDDPLQLVLWQELCQTLGKAILAMRNLRYRQVLIYTYLAGVDDDEMARLLQVREQDIYLWRHRALKTLRGNPEVMNVLRSLLE